MGFFFSRKKYQSRDFLKRSEEWSSLLSSLKNMFRRLNSSPVAFVGLSLEGRRDAGGRSLSLFGIAAGRELEAGREILDSLSSGAEISLNNNLDEGEEGATTFRRVGAGFETRSAGHGWQGEWKSIDEAGVLALVAELAPLNRGGHWSRQLSITRGR